MGLHAQSCIIQVHVLSRLGPPTLITNQENAPETRLQTSLMEEFSIKLFFFKITLASIKLTENQPGK